MNELAMQKQRISEAAEYIAKRLPQAQLAVVLGSGLSALADMLEEPQALDYAEIPHFKPPTVAGHAGKLIFGRVAGRGVYVLSGRFHYYEGHTPDTVILPMRVLQRLGCRTVILTNAAGGINRELAIGGLMLISDHINLTGYNPLRGENDAAWGPRFPDMSNAYDRDLRALAKKIAAEQGFELNEGVYCGLSGPNFETPAEIRMLRMLGADAVGMSTVPETLAANHMGMRVLAISCVTNLAAGVSETPLTHEEVFANSKKVEQRFTALLAAIIGGISL